MAKRKVWDLGVYSYPGGVQYSNRARTVGGDYEKIAFIGPSGLVSWSIDEETVKAQAIHIWGRINLDAAETRSKYFRALGHLRTAQPYNALDLLCDMAPADLLMDLWSFSGDVREKVDFMFERLVKAGRL